MSPLLALPLFVPDVTPEKTVQAFVEALNAHDLAAMARQVVGAKGGTFPPNTPPIPSLKANVGTAKIQGADATVEVDMEFSDPRNPSPYHETVGLHRVDGDWRIVPAQSLGQGGPVRPISIFALFATKPEAFVLAKKAAKKTVDLSHVKQIALAAMMYAGDHNDRLPTAQNFKVAVTPYLRDAEVWTAPDAPKGAVSYFLDPRLSGVVLTAVSRPAETAMILEGTPAKTAFPWEGKTPLGYADGHVKIVDRTAVYRARTLSIK